MTSSLGYSSHNSEYIPCPISDPGEACQVWRQDRLLELRDQVQHLGLSDDPEVAQLFQTLVEENTKVQLLWEKQREGKLQTPWWADGNYDAKAADRFNDDGVSLFKRKEFSEAFHAFTEAIRLAPTKAVYHCNRSMAALKIQKYEIALTDAENAIERDPSSLKALLRAASACLGLGRSKQASLYFQHILDKDPEHKAAVQGLKEAAKQILESTAREDEEMRAACFGCRKGLPLKTSLSDEECAEQLLSARETLRCNPELEDAKCAEVEALIQCRRYDDALKAVHCLKSGVTRLYLESEVAWRDGDLAAASRLLTNAIAINSQHETCHQLQRIVNQLELQVAEADASLEEEDYAQCMEQVSAILAQCHQQFSCSGLLSRLLCMRAKCFQELGKISAAKEDLNEALEHKPGCAGLHMQRYELFCACRQHTEAFFELQHVQRLSPDWPGLFLELQKTASLCQFSHTTRAGANDDGGSCYEGNMVDSSPRGGLYSLLGVKTNASMKTIRQAYHQLAAKWHPDKWQAVEDGEEAAAAEEQFKKIKAAYDTLSDSDLRFAYDAAHLRPATSTG